MQKLELRNNLFEIINSFKIKEIILLLSSNSMSPKKLLGLLVESKSAYDIASVDIQKSTILNKFELSKMYSNDIYTGMLSFLAQLGETARDTSVILNFNYVSRFYAHSKSLIDLLELVESLLLTNQDFFDEMGIYNVKDAIEKGNITLEIINNDFISLKKLKEIFYDLDKLVTNIYLFFDKVEKITFKEEPVISLIDSGSDININIKLPKEASIIIATLLKEMWEAISNNRSFRYQKKLKDIESSISIMKKISEAKINGIIEPEMEQILKQEIFENAVKLIPSNTLPRELVMGTREFSNRELLMEQTIILQIGDGKKNQDLDLKVE